MTKRRDFLKNVAFGSVAFSSFTGLMGYTSAHGSTPEARNAAPNAGNQEYPGWDIRFDEKDASLILKNGQVSLSGKLKFTSDGNQWKVVRSRDGIPRRYALVDIHDNVQGYFVFNPSGEQLQILFYHRTAQAYQGVFSFEGVVFFLPDGFSCRTKAKKDERVLALSCGQSDSYLNDSLFSPASDVLLEMDASELNIKTSGNGFFSFTMSGRIEEASEATWTFRLVSDYFANRYVPYYKSIDRKRCPKAPTGWMSWNTYFDKATAEDNLNEAKLGKKYFQPFGCEFWSIESWQGNSDQLPVRDFYNMNLEVNEKQFPKGMKKLADDIRALGFRPGLWTAPFGTGSTEFYNAHKHWFLHDQNGKPISSWNGKYTLDPTVREAREHLKEIHRIASREWGYEFFKIDGMSGRNHSYCAHLYERPEIKARFSDPSCPNPFELCIQAFRDGMGEDRVFLACQGHTSGPEALYADASRIGADIVHSNKPVQWSGVMNQGRCLMNQAFTHNIVMVADPDTLLVHDLPLEEARTSATVVALPGQLTFFGDKLAQLSEDRIKILQQTLPVADVLPVNLYPYFSMLPVWNLGVRHEKLGDYNVVAFFNWEDEKRTVSVTPQELGIPDTDYTGFEFWTEKPFSCKKGAQELSMEVPAHGVRLITLHRTKDIPQWISSDRHITQNGMELPEYGWNPETKTVEGKISLVGGFPLSMRLHVPENYSYLETKCKNAGHSAEKLGNILSVTFQAKKSLDADFKITFV